MAEARVRPAPPLVVNVLASSGDVAMQVVLAASIFVPLTILGVVCWVFWKAAKRDKEAS